MSEFKTLSYVAAELPFVPEQDSFIYLAPDWYRDPFLEERLANIKRGYSTYGYKLIYLPEVIGKITRQIISYNIPNYSGPMPGWQEVRDRFAVALSLPYAPVLVLFSDGVAKYVPLDLTVQGKSPVEAFLDECSLFAMDVSFVEKKPSRRKKIPVNACKKEKSSRLKIATKLEKIFDESIGGLYDSLDAGPSESSAGDINFRITPQEQAPQPPAADDEEILNEEECDRRITVNLSDLMKVGLSREQIQQLLNMKPKPSVLHITRSGHIFLEDYDHKRIVLDDLSTALYLLFLNHEEGINLKDLGDHYLELLDYYLSVSGKDDRAAMEKSIADLVVPGNNNVNSLISRIKRAFIDAFDVELAEQYFIKGKRGEDKFISLDRSLVIWDAIRPPYNKSAISSSASLRRNPVRPASADLA